MNEVGIPKGVYNVVHGFGPDSAGEFLTGHPGVDGDHLHRRDAHRQVDHGGRRRRREAGPLEMGGKNAGLVFADADFDVAVAGSVRSCFANAGQVCLGTERVYVQRPIFDEFVAALAKRGRGELAYGWPDDDGDRHRPAGLAGAPGQGARPTTSWPRTRARGAHRRRRPDASARPDGGCLGAADDLDRAGPDARTDQRGDLRPVRAHRPVRHRGRGVGDGQRHRVRPGGDRLDPGRRPRTPGRAADGGRHRLGQQLVPARPAHRRSAA